MIEVKSIIRAHEVIDAVPAGHAILERDERHLRRKAIALEDGEKIFLDFAEPVVLDHGDRLVLEDGREIEIRAAREALYEVRGAIHSILRSLHGTSATDISLHRLNQIASSFCGIT